MRHDWPLFNHDCLTQLTWGNITPYTYKLKEFSDTFQCSIQYMNTSTIIQVHFSPKRLRSKNTHRWTDTQHKLTSACRTIIWTLCPHTQGDNKLKHTNVTSHSGSLCMYVFTCKTIITDSWCTTIKFFSQLLTGYIFTLYTVCF